MKRVSVPEHLPRKFFGGGTEIYSLIKLVFVGCLSWVLGTVLGAGVWSNKPDQVPVLGA